MNKKKIIIAVVVVILLVAGIYLTFIGDVKSVTSRFSLKKGDKGNEVKKLQQALNLQGANLTVDGDFGQKTQDALLSITGETEIKSLSQFNKITKS